MNSKAELFHGQWKISAGWISNIIKSLSDDELKMEIIPGKNHGVWLLGHLIESEDDLSKFLGKAPMLFPHYEEIFGQGSKLKPADEYPPVSQLREEWAKVIEKNNNLILSVTDEEWNEPHCLDSGLTANNDAGDTESRQAGPDDFFQTKGRCIMIWILHQMYHAGQLAMILSKAGKADF
jgi:hypothetical protein